MSNGTATPTTTTLTPKNGTPQNGTPQPQTAPKAWSRNRTSKKIVDLFGFSRQDDEKNELEIEVFADTPPDKWFSVKPDSKYIFPELPTLMVLLALSRTKRNKAWISGYAGTGKTQLAINILNAVNYPFIRIGFDASTSRSDVVGRWTAKDGSTVFVYSMLIEAMRYGAAVICDEIDSANPDVMATLRPIFEENPHILVQETGELIRAHPDFRVIATGNTFGGGDETGLYRSVNVMSVPDRQRFPIKIKMDFLEEDVEMKVLMEEFPTLTKKEAKSFVKVANSIRSKFKSGELDEAMSPRELLAWVDTFMAIGDVIDAAHYSFLNGYPGEATVAAVLEIIRVSFPAATPATPPTP